MWGESVAPKGYAAFEDPRTPMRLAGSREGYDVMINPWPAPFMEVYSLVTSHEMT